MGYDVNYGLFDNFCMLKVVSIDFMNLGFMPVGRGFMRGFGSAIREVGWASHNIIRVRRG